MEHHILQNSNQLYYQLLDYLSVIIRYTGEQAVSMNTVTMILNLEISESNQLSSEQKNQLKLIEKQGRFLERQVFEYFSVFTTLVELLYRPAQVEWQHINLYEGIDLAVKSAQKFVNNFTEFVILEDKPAPLVVNNLYQLLSPMISGVLVWIYLFSPHCHIHVHVVEHENHIILEFFGYEIPTDDTKLVHDWTETACIASQQFTQLLLTVLGGSFSWNPDQIIPDSDKLTIQFPKNPVQTVNGTD